jgi:hypothetical protein
MIVRERCHRVARSRRDQAPGRGAFGHDALKMGRNRSHHISSPVFISAVALCVAFLPKLWFLARSELFAYLCDWRRRSGQGDPPAKYRAPLTAREHKARKGEAAFVGVGGAEGFTVVNRRDALLLAQRQGIRAETPMRRAVTLEFLAE